MFFILKHIFLPTLFKFPTFNFENFQFITINSHQFPLSPMESFQIWKFQEFCDLNSDILFPQKMSENVYFEKNSERTESSDGQWTKTYYKVIQEILSAESVTWSQPELHFTELKMKLNTESN